MGICCFETNKQRFNSFRRWQTYYELKGGISEKNFKKVLLVNSRSTFLFKVMKVVEKIGLLNYEKVECLKKRINLLNNLKSEFILPLEDYFQDLERIYFIFPYMQYGNLTLQMHKSFSESTVKFIAICILIGLEEIYKTNSAHLFIHPNNILIDEKGYCVLGGLTSIEETQLSKRKSSFAFSVRRSTNKIYSTSYQELEFEKNSNSTKECDYYNLGILLTKLLCKKDTERSIYLEKSIPCSCSNECIDFIEKLINFSFERSIGAEEFFEIWSHPWINLKDDDLEEFKVKQSNKSPFFKGENLKETRINTEIKEIKDSNECILQKRMLLSDPNIKKIFDDKQ